MSNQRLKYPRQPARRGILLSQVSNGVRKEFGKRITTSKRDCRRIERTVATRDLFGSGIISLTSGINFHIDAIFDGAATVMCASGRPALIARTAGALITASPSQLLDRMRIRNGFRS